jgi:hypothetical protein
LSRGKFILFGALALFSIIGIASMFKDPKKDSTTTKVVPKQIEEIPIANIKEETPVLSFEKPEPIKLSTPKEQLPEVDRISRLFSLDSSKLPIVETITYSSRVPWLQGRPAWIADYASHYATSRHFIARSLNHKPDYFTQTVSPGDRFNVLRKDLNLEFYLLIDLSKCKMWFYCLDKDAGERVLLKTYNVGLGRKDQTKPSGFLTPIGRYLLGSKIAIYKEGTKGYFHDKKVEMLQIFGTRWIPFERELENCSERAKGFGIHGSPWARDEQTDSLLEDRSHISKYDSDGCIRLNSEDIEELFSIIITRPTTVELVNDFQDAKPPFEEKDNFSTKSAAEVRS